MTRKLILDKLNIIFIEEFDDDSIVLEESTTAEDIEDWDSITNINLIVAIEHEFDMKFSMGEVNNMKNVGEMIDVIINRSTVK